MKKFGAIIVGVIFIAVGAFLYFNNQRLTKVCTVETTAIVVDMKEDYQIDEGVTRYTYYPIIEYSVDGRKMEQTMSSGSSTPAYRIGETITILYNPDKTTEFIVKGDKTSNILSIVFMALGGLLIVLGIVNLFKKV